MAAAGAVPKYVSVDQLTRADNGRPRASSNCKPAYPYRSQSRLDLFLTSTMHAAGAEGYYRYVFR
jgi:hypothetical protein